RAPAGRWRRDPVLGTGPGADAAAQPQLRHRLPVLFVVPEHDRAREHRLRAAHPARAPRTDRGPRRRAAPADPHPRHGRAVSLAAFGRPATARGPGPGPGRQPAPDPAGRAALSPGRAGAQRNAPRNPRSPAPPEDPHHHGDARSGRSPDAGRHHRLHEQRRHRAGRIPLAALSRTRHPLRRGLHRPEQPAVCRLDAPACARDAGRPPAAGGRVPMAVVRAAGAHPPGGRRQWPGHGRRGDLPGKPVPHDAALGRHGPARRAARGVRIPRRRPGPANHRSRARLLGHGLGDAMPHSSAAVPASGLRHPRLTGTPEQWLTRVCVAIPTLALILFFGYPLLTIFWQSFVLWDGTLGLDNYAAIPSTPGLVTAGINSLSISLSTTLVCILLGFPIAYALERSRIWLKPWVRLSLLLPLLAPSLVQGLGLLFLLGRNGLLYQWTGIEQNIYGYWGLLISDVFYALPQAIMIIQAALRNADARYYDAATVMGATPRQQFF